MRSEEPLSVPKTLSTNLSYVPLQTVDNLSVRFGGKA